ncbi:dTDP-4-dehydrorhamnose reductase [Cohnella sp. CFH 77786]|uniref:dTDP-4-dehydrorhamnose reductase n=1 Tax=Cohnella sp. CFH 77786 TaxID=2662265 RepID=UPI001C60F641|nr:dTDP-4-dehydrorhamnose reductase [Cohnella sp. CFH 77786]MBW5448496.1 dTDP-4-dehydrorhamnose reductase [Cohnella sp. CFH 77786]
MAERLTILVTGAGGQLGQELVRLRKPGLCLIGLDRQGLDITDAQACLQAVQEHRPNAVIHAAAYTKVDQAEADPETAYRVNVDGTRNMAAAAEIAGAKFCFVSTDYVFDGRGTRPYDEHDPTGAQTVYGRTKLEGERAALEACSRTFLVRTSWVYGAYGANFVHTMLNLAESRRSLRVVNDQTGSPTYTLDLAVFLLDLVQTDKFGIYHASNSGSCTWYQFAQAIFEESGIQVELLPCTTEEFPRPAPRPAYSVLGHDAMIRAGFAPLRHWREALRDFLANRD